MARTGIIHHFGTFLLLAATVLLIVTCISAPVINDISLMKVDLRTLHVGRFKRVTFGTFGWCEIADNQADSCSSSRVGYNPANIMNTIEGTSFSNYAENTTKALTKAMILHPIACGLNFIAFLLALGAGWVGSLLASLVAAFAFIVTLVVMILDFVLFSIIKSNVNGDDDDGVFSEGTRAKWGSAIWTTLAAAICSLLAMVILFFTCCSARIHKRRNRNRDLVGEPKNDYGVAAPATRRRRWF
ncbi:pali-domain-containing protein [Sordaria brevicollis]|uniref:Pali-domain-containing protein n=1 Tax=Sordaria brevicollis TaxID=83679 RepID=A0AAE0UGP2_SORBR|nr:pali-domain-containing protein [Sordaria brevicollis]